MMKKKFFLVLTLAAVFFGSCVSENESPAPFKAGETVEVKFRVGLETSPKTRTSDGSGYSNLNQVNPNNYSLRYKVAVYEGNKSSVSPLTLLHTDSALVDLPTTAKQQEFSFRLTSGTTYTVIGWADFVDKVADVTLSADKFYNTYGFPNVTLNDAAFTLNEEAKDAYFGVWEEPLATDLVEVRLKRPFGKIRFLVSDYTTSLEPADQTALRLSTGYYQDYLQAPPTGPAIYTTLDMLTGAASGDATAAQRGGYATRTIPIDTADRIVENGELVAFWDYILAPSADQINAGTPKPKIQFEAKYLGTIVGAPIDPSPTTVTYIDPRIVVERNKLTTVRADLFGGAPTVIRLLIDDDFEKPELEPLKVYVFYTDGDSSTISIARDLDGVGSFKCPRPVRAIALKPVPAAGDSIFIGTTKGFQNVTLKFDANDKIVFRDPAVLSGPIPVNSIAELELIKADANLSGKYVLEADIDLLSREWRPIGTYSGVRFNGTFDGAGHTVRNLSITTGDYVGFFGVCNTGSVIENLGVSGDVTGGANVGGVVGGMAGEMTACSFDGTVTGSSWVGGIAGYTRNFTLFTSTITACHSNGTVTGAENIGGLIGMIQNASVNVTACYSTAGVPATGMYIGSFYGRDAGGTSFTDCFTSGTAQGTDVLQFVTGWNSGTLDAAWGFNAVADGSGPGMYWKSLGDIDAAPPVYPKLWWEK